MLVFLFRLFDWLANMKRLYEWTKPCSNVYMKNVDAYFLSQLYGFMGNLWGIKAIQCSVPHSRSYYAYTQEPPEQTCIVQSDFMYV